MSRACTICAHGKVDEINVALAAREPYRRIAQRFDAPPESVRRHGKAHLPVGVIQRQTAKAVTAAGDIVAQLTSLQASALAILDKAETVGDLRAATGAVTAARGNLELIAKLLGELHDGPTVNLVVAPEWAAMRRAILDALAPFPDARLAVAEALRSRGAFGPSEATSSIPAVALSEGRSLPPALDAVAVEAAELAGHPRKSEAL